MGAPPWFCWFWLVVGSFWLGVGSGSSARLSRGFFGGVRCYVYSRCGTYGCGRGRWYTSGSCNYALYAHRFLGLLIGHFAIVLNMFGVFIGGFFTLGLSYTSSSANIGHLFVDQVQGVSVVNRVVVTYMYLGTFTMFVFRALLSYDIAQGNTILGYNFSSLRFGTQYHRRVRKDIFVNCYFGLDLTIFTSYFLVVVRSLTF